MNFTLGVWFSAVFFRNKLVLRFDQISVEGSLLLKKAYQAMAKSKEEFELEIKTLKGKLET